MYDVCVRIVICSYEAAIQNWSNGVSQKMVLQTKGTSIVFFLYCPYRSVLCAVYDLRSVSTMLFMLIRMLYKVVAINRVVETFVFVDVFWSKHNRDVCIFM